MPAADFLKREAFIHPPRGDPDLEERWTQLRNVRAAVNARLEVARAAKTIGSGLEAAVTLTVPAADDALWSALERHAADLPMLFIVSQVTLERTPPEGVSVSVARAEGQKCDRCWRTVLDVSAGGQFAGLCSRCVEALTAGDGKVLA